MNGGMDYCPEVAVLQSAFQLVNKQTEGKLSTLSKDNCDRYVKVIVGSVEEICSGLEFDLDLKVRELWQQKIHCLLFHSVVKNFYNQKVACTDKKVPILGPLDLLAELIPTFSCEFYFELVKQYGWSTYFLQCLQSLDASMSSSVLCDFLSHCQRAPITKGDWHVISVLSEKFLARCLCVPDRPLELCEELLKPLNQSKKYVTVVYPDVTDVENKEMELFVDKDIEDSSTPRSEQKVGMQLFDEFVRRKSDIFNLFLSSYEKQLDMYIESTEDMHEHKMFQILMQLEFWLYLFRMRSDNSCVDWFINNVFLSEDRNQSKSSYNERHDEYLMYGLNFVLAESLFCDDYMLRLHKILQRAIDLLSKLFKTVKEGKESWSNDGSQHAVQVVCGLSADRITLLRMLRGLMGVDNTHGAYTDLEEIFHADMSVDKSELILGEVWKNDVSLEAYVWRVTHKLPQYQVCIDHLLGDNCLQFWTSKRLLNTLQQCSSMLNHAGHVLRLSNILTSVTQNSSTTRETTLLLTNLIQTIFQELSFPDQDLIVKELYCGEKNYLSEVMRDGISEKVTYTLNKVTAELTDNVLKEILLMCIGDPIYVLDATLRLSTYNEQQAVSCSQIVRLVHKTCKCHHPVYHPDTSLIAHCIQRFLSSQTLSSKQQNYFTVFVSCIMANKHQLSSCAYGSEPVLSPHEFILSSVLPSLSAENVNIQTGIITSEFSLSLLLTALKACLELSYRDFSLRIELMPLLATLAEIQHKCLVCCEFEIMEESFSMATSKSESLVTMATKLRIREQINECLTLLARVIEKHGLMVHQYDIDWMLDTTVDMHLMVKVGLCDVTDACGYHEYREAWDVTMETCLEDFVNNLVTILQFVAVNEGCIRKILDRLPHVTISCDCLIVALVQVLPQCLSSEFGNIMSFIEELIASDVVTVTMMYKFLSTTYLPLIDYRVMKPLLHSSQILMYAMITLALTLKQKPWQQRSMLQTVITTYVGYLKIKCGLLTCEDRATSLIYLCELFHHVGKLALYVCVEDTETLLILLLQILTQYVTVCEQIDEEVSDESLLKLRNNLEDGLSSVIQRLPGNSEAKNMLCKKLGE